MSFASAVVLTPVAFTPGAATNIAAALSSADGTNGNRFILNPNTLLRVKNGSGAEITVTVNISRTIGDQTVPDETFTVPATTGDVIWKPIDPLDMYWIDKATREAHIEFSAVTTVTVKVYEA
jgi:hypothetical protein